VEHEATGRIAATWTSLTTRSQQRGLAQDYAMSCPTNVRLTGTQGLPQASPGAGMRLLMKTSTAQGR